MEKSYIIERAGRGELTADEIKSFISGFRKTLSEKAATNVTDIYIPVSQSYGDYDRYSVKSDEEVNRYADRVTKGVGGLFVIKGMGGIISETLDTAHLSFDKGSFASLDPRILGLINYNSGEGWTTTDVRVTFNPHVESTYLGYKNVKVDKKVTKTVPVPSGYNEAGDTIWVDKEMEVTEKVTVREPVERKKYTVPDNLVSVVIPEIVNNCIEVIVSEVEKVLTELSNTKPWANKRPIVPLQKSSFIRKWCDKNNCIIERVPDDVLGKLGFNLAVIHNTESPFSTNKDTGYINGFEPMYTEVPKPIRILGLQYTVCQLTGVLVPSSETVKFGIYNTSGKRFVVHSIYYNVLEYATMIILLNNDHQSLETRVLITDPRIWLNMDISKLSFSSDSNRQASMAALLTGNALSYIRFHTAEDASRLGGCNIGKLLKLFKVSELIIKIKSNLTFRLHDSTFDIVSGRILPTLDRVVPKPQTKGDISLNSMKFSSGPDKLIGFFRDDHPKPSADAKPGYRYYGMEIELECPNGDYTPDIMSGLIAPELVQLGFTYGTDGSLNNGLEFRSAPQGFMTLSTNLRHFFRLLQQPYDLSYSIYDSSPTPSIPKKPNRWCLVNGKWEWITEDRVESIPKPKKLVFTKPDSWKALPSCGLHIHVSRGSITELQLGKILTFVYSPSNRNFMVGIAGRTSERYAELTSNPPFSIDKDGHIKFEKEKSVYVGRTLKTFNDPSTGEVLKSFEVPRISKVAYGGTARGDKYTAVNTQHEHTIEFRLFKGVDNANEAITKLQFVDSLLEFTSSSSRVPCSLSDCMNKDKYLSWLTSDAANCKKYSLLIEYIGKLGAGVLGSSDISKVKAVVDRRSAEREEILKMFGGK